MDATTMPATCSLLDQLTKDYPELIFHHDDDFAWLPSEKTILYNQSLPQADAQLLHEIAHAVLQHTSYSRDIDLIAHERDAWKMAREELSARYGVVIDHDTVQDHLDTYRDWLHARSTCPHCQATGIQTADQTYRCVSCRQIWRVNEARTCGLKRYKQNSPS